ncbi:hypothetical protein CP488_02620 [Chthonomonas calidirosea]|nr:hypothetical protein CP488_02620 [Chthonomonas calidirosea]
MESLSEYLCTGMVCTKTMCNGTPKNCVRALNWGLEAFEKLTYWPHSQCEPGGVPNAYCSNFYTTKCSIVEIWPTGTNCTGPPVSSTTNDTQICGL